MSAVAYREGSWIEPSSRRAFSYRLWQPPAARRLLVVVHGFGEHGGRYLHVGEALAPQGLCVAVPDLWGHGRSDGRRGDILTLAQCAADCRAITEQLFLPLSAQKDYALYGHSFGGLVAIQWALGVPAALRRAVIQSPLLEVGFPIPQWKVQAAWCLTRMWPAFTFQMNIDADALSREPGVAAAYRTDPLVHGAMSVRSYCSIIQASDEAVRQAEALRTPILLLTGASDRIISVAAAQRWFNRLVCDKRQVVFPDCYHELHHEAVRAEVLQLVREWVLADA